MIPNKTLLAFLKLKHGFKKKPDKGATMVATERLRDMYKGFTFVDKEQKFVWPGNCPIDREMPEEEICSIRSSLRCPPS